MKKMVLLTFILLLFCYSLYASSNTDISLSSFMDRPLSQIKLSITPDSLSFTIPDTPGECVGMTFQFGQSVSDSTTACTSNGVFGETPLTFACSTGHEGQTYYFHPSDIYSLAEHSGVDLGSIGCVYVKDRTNSWNNRAFPVSSCSGDTCSFNNGSSTDFGTLSTFNSCNVDADCHNSHVTRIHWVTTELRGGTGTSVPLDGSADFTLVLTDTSGAPYLPVITINAYQATTPRLAPIGFTAYSSLFPESYYIQSPGTTNSDVHPYSWILYVADDGIHYTPADSRRDITFSGGSESSPLFDLTSLTGLTHLKFAILATQGNANPPLDDELYNFKLDITTSDGTFQFHISGYQAVNGGAAVPTTDPDTLIEMSGSLLTYHLISPSLLSMASYYPAKWALYGSYDGGTTYFLLATQYGDDLPNFTGPDTSSQTYQFQTTF